MNKAEILSLKFDRLTKEVEYELGKRIERSKHYSRHIAGSKCIQVDCFDYEELTFVNNALTFIDKGGYHHSLYSDCTLTDLIDILNK